MKNVFSLFHVKVLLMKSGQKFSLKISRSGNCSNRETPFRFGCDLKNRGEEAIFVGRFKIDGNKSFKKLNFSMVDEWQDRFDSQRLFTLCRLTNQNYLTSHL